MVQLLKQFFIKILTKLSIFFRVLGPWLHSFNHDHAIVFLVFQAKRAEIVKPSAVIRTSQRRKKESDLYSAWLESQWDRLRSGQQQIGGRNRPCPRIQDSTSWSTQGMTEIEFRDRISCWITGHDIRSSRSCRPASARSIFGLCLAVRRCRWDIL